MTTTSGADESTFPEMQQAAADAARAAAAETEKLRSGTADGDNPAPPSAYTEIYKNEIEQNMRAYRDMRWVAFFVIGILSALYLTFLLKVLHSFFEGHFLVSMLGAVTQFNWHLLVVISVALVLFAAVPLSLLMALVRMISDQKTESSEIKVPTTELVKICIDGAKQVIRK